MQGSIAVEAARKLGQASPAYLGKVSMSVAGGEAVAAFLVGSGIFGAAMLIMPQV